MNAISAKAIDMWTDDHLPPTCTLAIWLTEGNQLGGGSGGRKSIGHFYLTL